MPLPGGASDKAGNRYELRWAVYWAAQILLSRASRIQLEKAGVDEVEFVLRRVENGSQTIREGHQVKRQIAGPDRWTMSTLANRGVLEGFWRFLASGVDARCVFVSMDSAGSLRELADRSRAATTLTEFMDAFLSTSDLLRQEFSRLVEAWSSHGGENEAWRTLQRISVRTIDEATLGESIRSALAPSVTGDLHVATTQIGELLLDRLHQELGEKEIWQHLKARGCPPTGWHESQDVARELSRLTQVFSDSQSHTIGEQRLPREEAARVVEVLSGDARRVLVVGGAGAGKTCVLVQVVGSLEQQGWQVAALRADRIPPLLGGGVEIGRRLGLQGSPVAMLAAVSLGRPTALVIDQLDAISVMSGRNPALMEAITQLLAEANEHPEMRVILGCREFDLENDQRIRQLVDLGRQETIRVGRLQRNAVEECLDQLGLGSMPLSEAQVGLFSVPLHLSLLAEVVAGAHSGSVRAGAEEELRREISAARFATDLFALYWDRKASALPDHLRKDWLPVLTRLATVLNRDQALAAPWDDLLEFELAATALASAGVLVRQGHQVAFFHESFFDFCFARCVARDRPLLEILLEGEQHLFRRAQVRQVLLYRRGARPALYLRDLEELLGNDRIRTHLKQVVLSFVGQLDDPSETDWSVLEPLALEDDQFADGLFKAIHSNPSWFKVLRGSGAIGRWVSKDSPWQHRAIWLSRGVVRLEPELVTTLLEEQAKDERGSSLVRPVLRFAIDEIPKSRRLFEVFLAVSQSADGTWFSSHARGGLFWVVLLRVAQERSDWASQALPLALDDLLRQRESSDQPGRSDCEMAIPLIANGAPQEFLTAALGRVVEFLEQPGAESDFSMFHSNWVSSFHHGLGAIGALLNGTTEALSQALEGGSSAEEELLVNSSSVSVRTLLLMAAAKAPAATPRILNVLANWWEDDGIWVSDEKASWHARELIRVAGAGVPLPTARRLESLAIHQFPPEEEEEAMAFSQFRMLGAFDEQIMSDEGRACLRELDNRFSNWRLEAPGKITGGFVGPPIEFGPTEHMTDVAWTEAIAKYSSEPEPAWGQGALVGGASHLAQALQQVARGTPERFAQFFLNLSAESGPVFFRALLRALQDADLPPSTLHQVLTRAKTLDDESQSLRGDVLRLIACNAERDLPDWVLELVVEYACSSRSPEEDDWNRQAPRGDYYHGGDPYSNGINTTRGKAAECVARLMAGHPDRQNRLNPAVLALVHDQSVAVRSAAAKVCLALLQNKSPDSVPLFIDLCRGTEDALLGTPHVERFLYFACAERYQDLEILLQRMLSSGEEQVCEAGARLVSIAALSVNAAQPLAQGCLTGPEPQRKGAAQVYAANVFLEDCQEACTSSLSKLCNDDSVEVREVAASWTLGGEQATQSLGEGFLREFIDSQAFLDKTENALQFLLGDTGLPPRFLLLAVERSLTVLDEDPQRFHGGIGAAASSLVVRVYTNTSGDGELQSACLDAIDRLYVQSPFGLEQVLESVRR